MKVISGVALFVFFLPWLGCDRASVPGPGAATPTRDARAMAAEEDKKCVEALGEKGKAAEARDWLDAKHTDHIMWKGDKKELRALVDALYEAGTPAVHAVGIEDMSELTKQPGEMVACFVVTLPDQPGPRERVFKRIAEFWKPALEGADQEEIDELVPKDVGQKYYFLNLDL